MPEQTASASKTAASPGARDALISDTSFWVGQIFGVYSAWQDYEQQRWMGDYLRDTYRLNAKFAELQAKDAIRRGELAAEARGREVAQVVGQQRVAAAAQGLALGVGSPAELQAEAIDVGMMDALQIENNAYREAMGYRIEATRQNVAAAARSAEARQEAATTLTTRAVGTIGRITDRYYGSAGTGTVGRRG